MLRVLCVLLFLGAAGLAVLMGIVDRDALSPAVFRVDLSILLAGSLVALSVLGSPRGRLEAAAFVAAALLFAGSLLLILRDIPRLDKVEFDAERVKPFVIIMVGALVGLVVCCRRDRDEA